MKIEKAVAWIATAAAVAIGIYVTGSPWCLIAMLTPALTNKETKKKDDE